MGTLGCTFPFKRLVQVLDDAILARFKTGHPSQTLDAPYHGARLKDLKGSGLKKPPILPANSGSSRSQAACAPPTFRLDVWDF